MKSLLLILFVLLGGMSALYTRFKRVLAESEGRQDENEYEPQPCYENPFVDEDECECAAARQEEYFTYETADEPMAENEEASVPVMSLEEPVPQFAFDLRQAVVYQAVLNNRYINQGN